jgi:putative transposase
MRFSAQARRNNDVPEKVTMDKSGANKAALDESNAQ